MIIVMRNKILIISLIIIVVLLLSASCFSSNVIAQASIDPGYIEELYIQTDRDIYFSGEEVFVKVSKFIL